MGFIMKKDTRYFTAMFILFLIGIVLISGCSTQDYNKPYPKIEPKCIKDQIMYCEGRHPNQMECICWSRTTIEHELRNL